MRYLELVSTIDPRAGGIVAGIASLAAERARLGEETCVASLDAPGSFADTSMPFTWVGLGPGRGKYSYAPGYEPWLRAHAQEFDIVIINGLWQYHSFGARRALAAAGIPYLVFPHGMLDPWFKRRYPLKHLKKMLYWWLAEHPVLRDAQAVCFTSQQERLLARQSFRRYHVREQVVGYGIDEPPSDPGQREAFRSQVPQSAGKRVLLFLSRIHEKKGCDLLLHAFARTCAADPRWHLVMAGPDHDGSLARLQALAARLGIADRGELAPDARRAGEMGGIPLRGGLLPAEPPGEFRHGSGRSPCLPVSGPGQ